MADRTIVNGVYKPTYNWGAPSCSNIYISICGETGLQDVLSLCSLAVSTKTFGDFLGHKGGRGDGRSSGHFFGTNLSP